MIIQINCGLMYLLMAIIFKSELVEGISVKSYLDMGIVKIFLSTFYSIYTINYIFPPIPSHHNYKHGFVEHPSGNKPVCFILSLVHTGKQITH